MILAAVSVAAIGGDVGLLAGSMMVAAALAVHLAVVSAVSARRVHGLTGGRS